MQIEFKQLSTGRKGVELIKAMDVKLGGGQLVILTGANGAGKSTLLKTIAGLIHPLSGSVAIDATDVHQMGNQQRSRLIAYSNSKRIVEEYIRIEDLVALGRYPYLRVKAAAGDESMIIDRYIKAMGIDSLRHRFLNEISDGELQKASIARALVQDTPVILMDEPSAFLDYPSKKQLFALLKKMAEEEKKLVICATHDVEMAGKFGTQFWHLENREMQFSDRPIHWEL